MEAIASRLEATTGVEAIRVTRLLSSGPNDSPARLPCLTVLDAA